jgi:hypothetical protein
MFNLAEATIGKGTMVTDGLVIDDLSIKGMAYGNLTHMIGK